MLISRDCVLQESTDFRRRATAFFAAAIFLSVPAVALMRKWRKLAQLRRNKALDDTAQK